MARSFVDSNIYFFSTELVFCKNLRYARKFAGGYSLHGKYSLFQYVLPRKRSLLDKRRLYPVRRILVRKACLASLLIFFVLGGMLFWPERGYK